MQSAREFAIEMLKIPTTSPDEAARLIEQRDAEREQELRAPMGCGHPKACWKESKFSLGPDADDEVRKAFKGSYCTVCAEIAALKAPVEATDAEFDMWLTLKKTHKAETAALLHQAVQLVRENQSRHDCNELNWPQTFDQIEHELCALISADPAAALAEHDEQLRQKFSNECVRFHEEGHKCVTCGREDIEELKAQCAVMLEKAAGHYMKIGYCFSLYRLECSCGWQSNVDSWKHVDNEKFKEGWRQHILSLIPADHAAALAEVKREAMWAEAEWWAKDHPLGIISVEGQARLTDYRAAALRAEGAKQP